MQNEESACKISKEVRRDGKRAPKKADFSFKCTFDISESRHTNSEAAFVFRFLRDEDNFYVMLIYRTEDNKIVKSSPVFITGSRVARHNVPPTVMIRKNSSS